MLDQVGRSALAAAPCPMQGGDVGAWLVVRSPLAGLMAVPAVAVLVVVLVVAARWLGPASGWFAFVVVWFPMVWLGTMSRFVQPRLAEAYHALRPFERGGRVHELMGVRIAKAALRRGPLARFNRDLHLPADRTPARLEQLAQRMRDAEASHAVLFVGTLPVAVHALARGWWLSAVLTLVFDVLMNGYPVMLQRYNRTRLADRYALTWA